MTSIIGLRVDPTSYEKATAQIVDWARSGLSRSVWITNVHVLMEAHDNPEFRDQLNQADLVTPDGMPLAWVLRLKGLSLPDRVYGPTLMRHVLAAAEREHIPVGLYGSTPRVLGRLQEQLRADYPGLKLNYYCSPPFSQVSPREDDETCRDISNSGARVLFVGLGCPKQESWMATHRGRINAVMLGVGAAFDFLAGTKKQAPGWMQHAGLEWLFRLSQEPRRLWKRYLLHNPRFAVLAIAELMGLWRPRV